MRDNMLLQFTQYAGINLNLQKSIFFIHYLVNNMLYGSVLNVAKRLSKNEYPAKIEMR
jgi:hypothetical protein